ncbi:prolyl 4-hydroxylase subunit alpha-1-like [Drosophila obscura]|uniref:prolyl 4-hydroxylase subunit alpha-1-like n=1 Tax=Drosophila obscura TaxID=7282 RepID=UPI001BB17B7C|nr:prolyl 4-hydroxylase subunit alpha-1-like [Drosophila obscura]
MIRFVGLIFLIVLVQDCDSMDSVNFATDYYSSSVLGLLKLLEIERQFMEEFVGHADVLQEKLDNLQMYIDSLDRAKHESHKERERFVSNPLNAYGLIRRLQQDWPKWQNYTKKPLGTAQLQGMEELLLKAPDNHDLTESLKSMDRIERTYDLPASQIARGLLQHQQYDTQLSVRDCLALAQHKNVSGDYIRASMWYREALRHESEPNAEIINAVLGNPLEGVEHQFASAIIIRELGISGKSLSRTRMQGVASHFLTNSKPQVVDAFIRHYLAESDEGIAKELGTLQTPPTSREFGCRGLYAKRTNLVCRYNSTTTPFLRLAPLKMEEISHDPYIVMYHQVLSDREIGEMKQLAQPMTNGLSGSIEANNSEPLEVVARIAWLLEASPFRERLNLRIGDMTGFDVSEFKALQVANFGVGSYFKAHFDYLTNRIVDTSISQLGDRTGSLIIYAGEVQQGGATIFPDIQVMVPPQKGNSLFWYNTFDDSTPDPRSLHAVCPVIAGSRWTVTKWLHQWPQMFLKPCSPRPRAVERKS